MQQQQTEIVEQEQKLQKALSLLNEAFLEYRQKVTHLLKEQDVIIQKALKEKDQEQIQGILESLK